VSGEKCRHLPQFLPYKPKQLIALVAGLRDQLKKKKNLNSYKFIKF